MSLSVSTWWKLDDWIEAMIKSGLLIVIWLTTSTAQVITHIMPDGTLGTEVMANGTVREITGGTRLGEGPNLFHSFHRFNVGRYDTAHFVGQQGIENIIGRVTGGDASMINGHLQSNANLFFLNPSGVVFGRYATLDINGSFHVSTANVLRFEDGAAFAVNFSANSTLTVAATSSFGFLNEAPAKIIIEGSTLQVPPGETLAIVGGDIEIREEASLRAAGRPFEASGGQVYLASVASRGEVILKSSNQNRVLDMQGVDRLGTIRFSNAAIDAGGSGGGMVVIRSNRLLLNSSTLAAYTRGNKNGAEIGIDIEAQEMVLTDGALITTDILGGAGNGGDIRIQADSMEVSHGSRITTDARGRAGNGGDIRIQADSIEVSHKSRITTDILGGVGDGGISGYKPVAWR